MNILLAILAFNLIIILHELGHFLVAKHFDINVLEFSLFMGPKLFSIKRGETTYSLRMIPIGAFVLVEGDEEESAGDGSFSNKPLPVRAAVIAAGPLMNLLTALIFLCIVFTAVGYGTTKIGEVITGSPADLAGLEPGDRIITYSGKRVYQPADYLSFLMVDRGRAAEVGIVRAGEEMTTIVTPEVIPGERYILGFVSRGPYGPESTVIRSIVDDSPAAEGGLQSGDRIIKLDGKTVQNKQEISAYLSESEGAPVKVAYLRDGVELETSLTPKLEKGQPIYSVGLGFVTEEGNFLQVLGQSLTYIYSTMRNIVYTVGWLVTGQVSLTELMGPVRIVSTISNVVEASQRSLKLVVLNLLNILALISIALGGTNLLPFPALDGGRLLTIGISVLLRKPIPPNKEAIVSLIGLVFLMILGIFTILNDVVQLIFG
ncbi:MAG TPA: RIP metalloprotease RseP [Firmicutes bacterium]|nr:RIP metalloprotease RseP [Bacillota bacterium]